MGNLIFLGDSITDADHLWTPDSLGHGYVSLAAAALQSFDPSIRVYNKGQDGFTAAAVLRNLDRNCLSLSPDSVSLLVGINDVAVARRNGVSLTDLGFRSQLHAILARLKDACAGRVFCMGPFVFSSPAALLPWAADVREAERLFAAEAAAFGLPFLPLQDAMSRKARRLGTEAVTTDGVHLTGAGHAFLARLWLDAFASELKKD